MVEIAKEEAFHLTVSEFFFLTQMLGIQSIAGFKDPFQGYLIEELEEEFAKVKRRLLDKAILNEKEGSEELEMNEVLSICLACCGSDTAVYLKKTILPDEPYEAFLYFTPNLVVERTWNTDGMITIAPVANPELTMNILAKFFPLTLRGETPFQLLLKNVNSNAWDALSEPEKETCLKERQIAPEDMDFVLRMEKNPDRSGTMAFWNRIGFSWEEASYRYRQSGKDMFLLTEPEENSLSIRQYRPEPIIAALEQLAMKFDLVNEGARS
ncbi:hypothetical protein V3851_26355 [Paenibacillus sp. M1]|uniref:ESAT-6 protein secretion system EspG family protein n=1 Tax=Paenibacillus haidiansis TaxID=1574488 RepID=A0ABU7W0N1_9BACL